MRVSVSAISEVNPTSHHCSGRNMLQTGIGTITAARRRYDYGTRDWRTEEVAGKGQGVEGKLDIKGM